MVLAVGTKLGRYEIRSQLGAGGMGEVYLAQDMELDRTVALKILPQAVAADGQRLHRFLQEARAASKLSHPNVAHIYEIKEHDGIRFIAMEYIEGQSLDAKMRGRQLTVAEIVGISIQIADALDEAHAKSITHRDIKSANIMITPRDQVKVLDFGLAKITGTSEVVPGSELPTQVKTNPGVVMGTVGYMSPEQALGREVDHRSDIFSLGVVLYEMATGRLPFTGESVTEIIDKIAHAQPEAIARFNYNVPSELERVIKKALRKDRAERYQSVREMLVDLKSLKQELEFEAKLEQSVAPETNSGAISTTDEKATTVMMKKPAASTAGVELSRATTNADSLSTEGQRHRRWVILVASVALAVGLAVASYFYLTRSSVAAIDSIAVLPFVNASADPDTEYLSDGITESITNSLSQLPNLVVISRSSVFRYKGREIDPRAVGRELGVSAVVTGRIVQRGDSLSISAELVDVNSNRQLWGDQYNRKLTDILTVQEELSKQISEKLRLKLTGEEQKRVTKRYTENTEAYQFYLQGRYHWNKRNREAIKKAAEYFEQAIAKDPGYALAYAGLADCYIVPASGLPAKERMPKAKAAALKALEIDETLSEPHASLGAVKQSEFDWAGSEQDFKRAIELNPNYATAHQWYAEMLTDLGRHNEAIAEINRARELDPFSLVINATAAWIYFSARQYDQAIEQARRTLEMDAGWLLAHVIIIRSYERKGMYEEMLAQAEQMSASLGGTEKEVVRKLHLGAMKEGLKTAGIRGFWQKRLEIFKQRQSEGENVPPVQVAEIYANLGDKDQAFAWLQKAFDERETELHHIKVDPGFDSLRSDSRYADLLRRMNLAP